MSVDTTGLILRHVIGVYNIYFGSIILFLNAGIMAALIESFFDAEFDEFFDILFMLAIPEVVAVSLYYWPRESAI